MNQSVETVCDFGTPAVEYRSDLSVGVTELNANSPASDSVLSHMIFGAVTGVLTGFSENGAPLVDFPENKIKRALIARSTLPVSETQVGQEVVLLFERGDVAQPIIVGSIQPLQQPEGKGAVAVTLDGEQLIFTAEKEIVLRCGKSSITLTRAGKVLIRGEYVLSRASGENRIKGGSVQIH
jgi:hypothetical protein